MKRLKLLAASSLIALFLAACGGSGGSGGSVVGGGATDIPPNTTTDTVISGMASVGPITGTIGFYTLNDSGSKGSLLKSAPIVNGSYSSINIGKYAGPVIIEVYGSYTDEATGLPKTISADAPLRAAIANAAGTISVAVTPLTELAVRHAGALTASAIDASNLLVSDIFKIDIINTQPVAPTSKALSLPNVVSQSQKDYTLALAAISQLSKTRNNEPLSATLTSVADGISPSGMDSQTVTNFRNAINSFIVDMDHNLTGITDLSSSNLVGVGSRTATYKLAITRSTGTFAQDIKGLQFEIVIPAGLTVRYNPNSVLIGSDPVAYDHTKGNTLSGVVTASASVAAAQPYFDSVFSSSSGVLTFGLYIDHDTDAGVGKGDLATVTCDVLPGWTAPPASAFSVKNIMAVKSDITTLTDVNVTVTEN